MPDPTPLLAPLALGMALGLTVGALLMLTAVAVDLWRGRRS
jgi:hypothetical protein